MSLVNQWGEPLIKASEYGYVSIYYIMKSYIDIIKNNNAYLLYGSYNPVTNIQTIDNEEAFLQYSEIKVESILDNMINGYTSFDKASAMETSIIPNKLFYYEESDILAGNDFMLYYDINGYKTLEYLLNTNIYWEYLAPQLHYLNGIYLYRGEYYLKMHNSRDFDISNIVISSYINGGGAYLASVLRGFYNNEYILNSSDVMYMGLITKAIWKYKEEKDLFIRLRFMNKELRDMYLRKLIVGGKIYVTEMFMVGVESKSNLGKIDKDIDILIEANDVLCYNLSNVYENPQNEYLVDIYNKFYLESVQDNYAIINFLGGK